MEEVEEQCIERIDQIIRIIVCIYKKIGENTFNNNYKMETRIKRRKKKKEDLNCQLFNNENRRNQRGYKRRHNTDGVREK